VGREGKGGFFWGEDWDELAVGRFGRGGDIKAPIEVDGEMVAEA